MKNWLASLAYRYLCWWVAKDEPGQRGVLSYQDEIVTKHDIQRTYIDLHKVLSHLQDGHMAALEKLFDFKATMLVRKMTLATDKKAFDTYHGELRACRQVVPLVEKVKTLGPDHRLWKEQGNGGSND